MKTLKQREDLQKEVGLDLENEMGINDMAYMKGRGAAEAATGGDASSMCQSGPLGSGGGDGGQRYAAV